jgi:hypothetical protein
LWQYIHYIYIFLLKTIKKLDENEDLFDENSNLFNLNIEQINNEILFQRSKLKSIRNKLVDSSFNKLNNRNLVRSIFFN